MIIRSAYRVKIQHYNHIFDETVSVYRDVENFCEEICLSEWDAIRAAGRVRRAGDIFLHVVRCQLHGGQGKDEGPWIHA